MEEEYKAGVSDPAIIEAESKIQNLVDALDKFTTPEEIVSHLLNERFSQVLSKNNDFNYRGTFEKDGTSIEIFESELQNFNTGESFGPFARANFRGADGRYFRQYDFSGDITDFVKRMTSYKNAA